jgi:alkanesulfonate monooxygenase SsuD/methylene tetrahydromethanopterin reductase-like flavin-dependent oxidoreductase (luciferase family)
MAEGYNLSVDHVYLGASSRQVVEAHRRAGARSVATIRELAGRRGRSLDGFLWMAYVFVAVDSTLEEARKRAAQFLGATYAQDFTELIDRVALTRTLDTVVERLVGFVRAGARHLVLLPCRDQASRDTSDLESWLPELMAGVRGASLAPREDHV